MHMRVLLLSLFVMLTLVGCTTNETKNSNVNNQQSSNSSTNSSMNTNKNTNTSSTATQNPDAEMLTTESGLQYQDVVVGTGKEAVSGNRVSVHYTGTFPDGTVFDSSVSRGVPFEFVLGAGQVIKGWDEGVAGMKIGGKRLLIIPAELGYGSRQVGPIPPNSILHFEVELLGIQ